MIRYQPMKWIILVMLLAGTMAQAATMPPGEATDELRRQLGKVERLLLGEANGMIRQQAAERAENAYRIYLDALSPDIAGTLLDIDGRIRSNLDALQQAAASGKVLNVAVLRQDIWSAVLEAGFRLTKQALQQGDALRANAWLAVREYPRTGAGTRASDAMQALLDEQKTPGQAWSEIEGELLQTYTGELHRAIREARKAIAQGYTTRAASWSARVQGLTHLLQPNLAQRLGDAQPLMEISKKLVQAARRGDHAACAPLLNELEDLLSGYAPTALPPNEVRRLSNLLLRFIKLIDFDYNIGVHNGKVVIPLDYREAVIFRDRAEQLLGNLQGELPPDSARHLHELLEQMQPIITQKRDGKEISRLTEEATMLLQEAFALESISNYSVAFQLLPEALDQIPVLAEKGDWEGAELKRLEAYAFFDPDIEQHLMPRAPSLALALESLFWEGNAEHPGLQRLIDKRASADRLLETIEVIKAKLAEVEQRLTARAGPLAVFLQSLAIMIREGLEAVLVIGALLGVLRAMQVSGYARYIWGGVGLGVAASFLLWWLAGRILTVTTLQRELLEGVTALLAAAVLVYVTHWIFHKTYVVQWVDFVRQQVQRSVSSGHLMAVGLVSFFVVFREGFETVLFYQALMLEGLPAWVLAGFVAGMIGTAGLAWALLKLGRRLPVNHFFVATGLLLMLLALIFTGFGIRGLQTAGLASATPVPGFPESPFLQLYFGLFPTWESLLAQIALLVLFVGGAVAIHTQASRRTGETRQGKAVTR